jgi:hypothetical protein
MGCMDGHRELGLLAEVTQGQVDSRAMQGPALRTKAELPSWGLHASRLHQPGLDDVDLIPPQRVAQLQA